MIRNRIGDLKPEVQRRFNQAWQAMCADEKLKDMGVSVMFENENIDTKTMYFMKCIFFFLTQLIIKYTPKTINMQIKYTLDNVAYETSDMKNIGKAHRVSEE